MKIERSKTMSAFIVSNSTINAAVSWISCAYRDRNFSHIASYLLPEAGYDIKDDPEALPRLTTEMFALNVDAVNQRYSDKAAEQFRPLDFAYEMDLSARGAVHALKLLQCWHYQCSEGDVPETPLYQLMGRVIGEIALGIVCQTEAYDRAPWGH
jgi:hypothetical protein